jgi:hypothetical protein
MRVRLVRAWLLTVALALGSFGCNGDGDEIPQSDSGCNEASCDASVPGESDAAKSDADPSLDDGASARDAPGGEDAELGEDADAAVVPDACTNDSECPGAQCVANSCVRGPTAAFSLSASNGVIPLVVRATSAAAPGDAPLVSVRYDFTGAGFAAADSHRYVDPGQFTVRQEVRDENGLTAVANAPVVIGDFKPIRWSTTDHDALVFLSPDRLMLENRGEDRGGARSDGVVQPGSGVFYFEAERLIDRSGVWGIGVATAQAVLDQPIGTSAQSLGLDTYGKVMSTGATCSGGEDFDPAQRHYGFVIDYRGANPSVHVLLEEGPGKPVVQRSCVTTLTAPLHIFYAGVRYAVGYQLKLNAGSDLTNFPFHFQPSDVRAALSAAGASQAAAALVPGFGQTRSVPPDTPPVLSLSADQALPLGAAVLLTGTASDAEDGDLSARIVWTVLSSQHHAPLTGTGASFTFTPNVIGRHPVLVSVTDRDEVKTERVVKVEVTGALPRFNPVRLAPDPLAGQGIALSADGLSARFDGQGKYGVRANQPIYGRYWYFEAHRQVAAGNMGVGLVIGDGSLNPYDFVNVPWSCSINLTGNTWRNLISLANWPSANAYYGFAVDYRDVHPKVHIIVGGTVHMSLALDDVWVPVHPMVYGNPQGTAPPAMDLTVNFGASPFQFDARAILTAAGVDTTGLSLGWGDANTP